MNDDQQEDVKQEAGEEASISEPSAEEPKAAEEAVEEVADTTDKTEETVDAPKKKGSQARIRELTAKAKGAEERAQSLEERVAELTGRVDQSTAKPYTPQIEPGQEYDTEQLKQEVYKTADSIATLRVKQSEAISRIKNETEAVVQQYPELDPTSDSFDQELSESVTEAVEAKVMSSPYTASPKDIVNKMMKPYKRAVTKGVGEATENIAKQVSQAATRPTAISRKGGKKDAEKTIEELEAELGVHQF